MLIVTKHNGIRDVLTLNVMGIAISPSVRNLQVKINFWWKNNPYLNQEPRQENYLLDICFPFRWS